MAGAVPLAGWLTEQLSWAALVPDYGMMLPNTAAGLLLMGLSALLAQGSPAAQDDDPFRNAVGAVLAVPVVLLGALTLMEYVGALPFSIDALIITIGRNAAGVFSEPRMAPATAAALLTGGFAALCACLGRLWASLWKVAHILAFVPGIVGIMTLIGYLYGGQTFFRSTTVNPVSAHTAIALLFFSFAMLLKNPFGGWLKDFRLHPLSRRLLVNLLLLAVSMPIAVGILIKLVRVWINLTPAMMLSLLTFITMATLFLVIWWLISGLRNNEAQMRYIIEQLRLSESIAAVGYWQCNLLTQRYTWSTNHYRLFGLDPDAHGITQATFLSLVHPNDRSHVNESDIDFDMTFKSYNREFRILRADNGEERWLRSQFHMLSDGIGQPLRAFGIVRDITAEKRTFAELERSRRQLKIALSSSGIGVHDFDVRRNEIMWDSRTREMWGVSDTQPINYEFFEGSIHPDDRESVRRAVEQAFMPDGAGEFQAEYRITRAKDGAERWVAASGLADFASGRAVRLIGTVRDVTTEKTAALMIRQSLQRYRSLVHAIGATVWTMDGQKGFIGMQISWQKYTGQTWRMMRGDGWLMAVHEDDRAAVDTEWRRAVRTGRMFQMSARLWHAASKTHRQFIIRAAAVRGNGGNITEWIGVGEDVDHQYRTAAVLRATEQKFGRSQAQLKALFDALPLGIIFADSDSAQAIEWNERSEHIFGREALLSEQGILSSHWNAYKRDGAPLLPEDYPIHQMLKMGRHRIDMDIQIQYPDQSRRWFQLLGAQVHSDRGEFIGAVVAALDIDAHVRGIESQKMLVAELNHRVKNTLAVVRGLASLSYSGRQTLEAAQAAFGSRLQALSLAHDILTDMHWHAVSVRQLFSTMAQPFDPQRNRIELQGDDFSIAPRIAITLSLALHELFTNAVKYGALSLPHGHILIAWTLTPDVSGILFRLQWTESGGPPVLPPRETGFGTRMLRQALALELDGEVALHYRPEGLVCEISAALPH